MAGRAKNILLKSIGMGFNGIGLVSQKKATEWSLKLFFKPRKGKVNKSYQEKFLSTATQEKLSINGMTIAGYSFGNGPKKILLLHGWESNTWRWRKLIQHLGKEQYTFYSIDAPAHGKSSEKTFSLLQYNEAINYVFNFFKPDVIIGHSMGGLANLTHAHHYKIGNEIKLVNLASPHSLKYIFGLYFDIIGIAKNIKASLTKNILEVFNIDIDQYDVEKIGSNINNKLLIIHDKEDTINHAFCAEKSHKAIKNSSLMMVTDLGHSLQSKFIFDHIKQWINDN